MERIYCPAGPDTGDRYDYASRFHRHNCRDGIQSVGSASSRATASLFTSEDDFEDPAFCIWHANYRPETEAHDLLYDLFQDQITGPFGARLPGLGLELGEHPSTPRYATAKLDGDWCLPRLAEEVAARTT